MVGRAGRDVHALLQERRPRVEGENLRGTGWVSTMGGVPGSQMAAHSKLTRLAVALGAALVLVPAALAASRTTAPSNKVTVLVLIDDKRTKVFSFVQLGNEPQKGEVEASAIQTLTGPIPRGDYLTFNILNRGKKPHDFTIFGKKTKPIKPGKKARLFVIATVRG